MKRRLSSVGAVDGGVAPADDMLRITATAGFGSASNTLASMTSEKGTRALRFRI